MKLLLTCLAFILIQALPASAAVPVWIDTDPSVARGVHEVDDGFALIQAFHSPELEIRGISLVFGNSPLPVEVPIGRRLVKEFGSGGMSVYTGATSAQQLGTETDASRALAAALQKENLVVLAIGPVTNVATVLRNHPELSSHIGQVIAVAGRRPGQKFRPSESVQPFRDFNFESDPAAFQVLLDSGVPLVLAPWEISSKVWMHADDLQKIRSADPATGWVLDAAQDWLRHWSKTLHTEGFNPFDTLAVAYAISPAGFECEKLPAHIRKLKSDTAADEAATKPYLIVDKSIQSKTEVLYCSQPPANFIQDLVQRVGHAPQAGGAGTAFDYSTWNKLAKRYINNDHRVDYQALKQNEQGRLDAYLQQFENPWPAEATPSARKAALINVYNALTVRWILRNYPVESIWRTKHPFSEARHQVNGTRVSLDDIETQLREMGDSRIHAALVCAARSCPPLRREAYDAGHVDAQLDSNVREWLANTRLNEFFPARNTAKVSMIFKWYGEDFEKAGGSVKKALAQYGPEGKSQFLLSKDSKLDYKDYSWGLNDSSKLGSDYSKINFWWDALRNK